MTEVWRSNKMHWCDLCRVWMNDNKVTKLNHERGMKHQDNLQRKLREMTRKADTEKKTQETAARNFERIERQARQQYEEEQRALEAVGGKWTWDASCNYYYNDLHRYYYDPKTRWYYGGEPTPTWVQNPPLPTQALFGTAKHEGGPVAQPAQSKPATTGVQGPGTSSSVHRPSPPLSTDPSPSPTAVATAARTIELPKHPLSGVGGDWQIKVGRVGAAKGIGLQGSSSSPQPQSQDPGERGQLYVSSGDKRKREDDGKGGGKKMSKEEEEFVARREAARQRVNQRTAQNFGYL